MKKLMTMALAAAFVCAVAGQAHAAALETKGEFRARFWYLDKYFQTLNPNAESTTEFEDQRLRLYLTWPVSEGVKIQARADVLEQFWGASADFNNLGFFTNNNQIDFDWVNAVIAVPNTPVTLTIGKQDVTWGLGVLAAKDNRFRAKAAAKIDTLGLGIAYDKNIETLHGATLTNGVSNQDDSDGVTVSVTSEAAGFKFGVLGAYGDDQTESNVDKKRYGVDGFVTGQAGPVAVGAEVAYYTGKNDVSGGGDQDVSGVLAYVSAGLPVGPASVTAEFAYASGDDPDTKKNEGVLKFDYQAPFWSVILFNNFELPGWESNYGADSSVNNAWAGKLSASAKVMPALTLYGAAVYAARIEDTAAHKADPLGTELDLIAMYALTENVGINVGGAYLFVGDYYGDNIDDTWGATAQVVVNF